MLLHCTPLSAFCYKNESFSSTSILQDALPELFVPATPAADRAAAVVEDS